jgi:hypothetical protein
VRAPDYVEAVVGWRLWHVVETGAGLRLRSPLYRTVWTPRQEMIARCRRGAESAVLLSSPRTRHSTPDERCSCGIYASRTPAQAAAYLSRFFKQREGVLHRVIGQVSLYGLVVECERGWRASRAYPALLYVPVPRRRRPSLLTGVRPSPLPAEEITWALGDYGVPVEVVGCATVSDLAERLDSVASSIR